MVKEPEQESTVGEEEASEKSLLREKFIKLLDLDASKKVYRGDSRQSQKEERERKATREARGEYLEELPDTVVALLDEQEGSDPYDRDNRAHRLGQILDDMRYGFMPVVDTEEATVVASVKKKGRNFTEIPSVMLANAHARPRTYEVITNESGYWAIRALKPEPSEEKAQPETKPLAEPSV